MKEQDILSLIAEALGLPPGQVTAESRAGDFEPWDSLGMLNITIALQRAGVPVGPGDIESLQSVQGILAVFRNAGTKRPAREETKRMTYRLAKPCDCDQMASIALACKEELNNGITFQLGPRFLREYYRRALREKGCVALVVVDEADPDRVLGFTFGTLDAGESMRTLRKNRIRLALAALPAILRRPRLIVELLARYRATSENSKEQYVIRSGARKTFMAMLPEARAGGQGILLVRRWLAVMRLLGAGAIRVEVDANNIRSVAINRQLGATVIEHFVTPSGTPRVFLEYGIPNAGNHS